MLAIAVIALVVALGSLAAAVWATYYARASARAAHDSSATAERAELRDAARRSDELSAYLVVTAEMGLAPRTYPHVLLTARRDFSELVVTQTDQHKAERDLTLSNPTGQSGPIRINHLSAGTDYPVNVYFLPPWVLPQTEPPKGVAQTTVRVTAHSGSDKLDATYPLTWGKSS